MAVKTTQISATISWETKRRLEDYVKDHGVKKAHLIETALLHHLHALEEIPSDVIIPPLLKVSAESGEKLIDCILNPPPPTEAMRALWDDRDSAPSARG
jgi:hypothetical protein